MSKFNDWLGLKITNMVGTMWCAYLFCAISLTSLKPTLAQHSVNADVQWIAQTFLQLVLLSVIMVGQNVQSKRAAQHAEQLAAIQDSHDELHAKLEQALPEGP